MTSTAPEGQVLGDFALRDKLGEGGFGTVYRAEQRSLERAAVVKVMRRSLAASKVATERFVLEAKLASRFDHPYAAHVYAFGAEPDGMLWIAMELVRGTPLSELVAQQGPLTPERFLPLVERLCEVIQAAHDQGIVHRDIKPSNVMVIARSGRLLPKLLDFGIAKSLDDAPAAPRAVGRAKTELPTELADTAASVTDAETATGSLTLEGQILGSPLYMAPEQWIDATKAGPAADQYALALLAFEAMTGTRAVHGATLTELMERHANGVLPRHAALSTALHAVLAKAASRDAAHRYANLHDFAAALRTAIAPGEEPEAKLELPDAIAAWAADAPRPIADAMAAIAGARSAMRVADRTSAAASTLARWLGALALACRSKLAQLDSELVRALRRRPLRDEEWLDLVDELARPLADKPAACPIPELVETPLGSLRALVRGEAPLAIVDGSAERTTALAKLAQLDEALGALAWLLDYEVGREIAGGLEVWMGASGDDEVVRVMPQVQASDRVVVLDADGASVVALTPIVRVAPPAAGEAARMFLLAGPGRDGDTARLVAPPHGFELEVDDVWKWLGVAIGAGKTVDDARSPYPGLTAFTGDDHASFVGREREVEAVVNRLRAQPLVAVVGPSGVGKSSFLAAGVAHALPGTWRPVVIRPGEDPMSALSAMASTTPYRGGARATTLADLAQDETICVIVDQAEELFTMCSDAAARAAFADALRAPNLRVAIGVRDDFFVRLDELFGGRLARAVHVLRVPGEDELARMVEVPATRRGFAFEDAALPRAIAKEVAGRPGALPLLAFACAELWQRRDRHFHRIPKAAYAQIGGVTGALIQHADGVVDGMPAADQRAVRLAFRRLLSPEGTRALVEKQDLDAKILDQLLAARLISERDATHVEIVHEALVQAWPRLARWRRDDDADARVHARIAAAAKHWDERGRDAGLLWRGEALVELRTWSGNGATAIERAFADASQRAATRARRRRLAGLAGAFAVLGSGAIVLGALAQSNASRKRDAVSRLAASLEERGRQTMLDDDAARALVYLTEARKLGAHDDALDLLSDRATSELDAQIIARQTAGFGKGQFDELNAVFVDADGTVRAWDRASRARTGVELPHAFAAAPAGARIAVLDRDGGVRAVDRDGKLRWRVAGAHDPTAFVHDAIASSTTALTFGPMAKLWNLDDGTLRGELTSPAQITAAALAPGGARAATGDLAGNVRVWDAATGAAIATCAPHAGRVRALVFTGDVLASAGDDGAISLCTPGTGATTRVLDVHGQAISALGASSTHLASGGLDGSVRLWNLASGTYVRLAGHTSAMTALRFSPDGAMLATAGLDAAVRIWDVDAGLQVATLAGVAVTPVVAWDADGAALVTSSLDGTIRRWDLAHARRGRISHVTRAANATYAATAGRLAIIDDEGVLELDPTDLTVTARHAGASALLYDQQGNLVTGRDGHLAVYGRDGTIVRQIPGTWDDAISVTTGIATLTADATLSLEGAHPVKLPFAPRMMVAAGRLVVALPDAATNLPAVVVDPARGEIVAKLQGDHGPTIAAASADELAIDDGTAIRTFSLNDFTPRAVLRGHQGDIGALGYLADGRLVSGAGDQRILVWRGGELIASISNVGGHVTSIASDGATFATNSMDGAVRVWNATTYAPLLVQPSSHAAGSLVVYQGDAIVGAGQDGRVARWELPHATPSLASLEHTLRCRVPYKLDHDALLPAPVEACP